MILYDGHAIETKHVIRSANLIAGEKNIIRSMRRNSHRSNRVICKACGKSFYASLTKAACWALLTWDNEDTFQWETASDRQKKNPHHKARSISDVLSHSGYSYNEEKCKEQASL